MSDCAKLADVLPVEYALKISEMLRALGYPFGSDVMKRYALLLRELMRAEAEELVNEESTR